MPERGTAPSPKQREHLGPGSAIWEIECPACGSKGYDDYEMVDDYSVSDWLWEAIETSGTAYVCKKCGAQWVDPDFEQIIRWERPDPAR